MLFYRSQINTTPFERFLNLFTLGFPPTSAGYPQSTLASLYLPDLPEFLTSEQDVVWS